MSILIQEILLAPPTRNFLLYNASNTQLHLLYVDFLSSKLFFLDCDDGIFKETGLARVAPGHQAEITVLNKLDSSTG